jgi:hypothetical protein
MIPNGKGGRRVSWPVAFGWKMEKGGMKRLHEERLNRGNTGVRQGREEHLKKKRKYKKSKE